ncbi:MAG TPA: transketolase C-terminal domain-containing protein [Candidatus Paceibacterota bacterium]
MLNPELKLNPHVFDANVEQAQIRKGFGDGLLAAAMADKNVVGLCADLTESTQMLKFKEKFPERFVEIGVAEQNLVTVASGMAAMGKIPFVSSYATFSPGRNWEQIRTTITYNHRPVKIAGSHAGVSVGPDGGSHQALEDIAIMRVLPRMTVFTPCDAIEARKVTLATAKTDDPAYVRLAREKTPVITTDETPFQIGRAQLFWIPNLPKGRKADAVIFVAGSLMIQALRAARDLEALGKHVYVVNIATIKPLDQDTVIRMAHETGAAVTVEEHQTTGGLGGSIAECLAAHHPVPIEFIGVKDQFGQSGKPDELIAHYGMHERDIIEAVKRVIVRK